MLPEISQEDRIKTLEQIRDDGKSLQKLAEVLREAGQPILPAFVWVVSAQRQNRQQQSQNAQQRFFTVRESTPDGL